MIGLNQFRGPGRPAGFGGSRLFLMVSSVVIRPKRRGDDFRGVAIATCTIQNFARRGRTALRMTHRLLEEMYKFRPLGPARLIRRFCCAAKAQIEQWSDRAHKQCQRQKRPNRSAPTSGVLDHPDCEERQSDGKIDEHLRPPMMLDGEGKEARIAVIEDHDGRPATEDQENKASGPSRDIAVQHIVLSRPSSRCGHRHQV